MIGLALLVGVILGLRFRVGLVLTATAAVLALDLGIGIGEGSAAAAVLARAALHASIIQVVALLVHVFKDTFKGGVGALA
jgi:hypothetical protein